MYDKVIFLDFDGVINANRMKDCVCLPMTNIENHRCHNTVWGVGNIKPFLSLMKWCYNNHINLVISSTWRLGMNPKLFNNYLNEYFGRNDLPIVIGVTQVVAYPNFMHRGTEIQDYLNKHKEINKYLCIDDSVEDILETIPKENVYKTDGSIGLTDKDIKNIKRQWEEL